MSWGSRPDSLLYMTSHVNSLGEKPFMYKRGKTTHFCQFDRIKARETPELHVLNRASTLWFRGLWREGRNDGSTFWQMMFLKVHIIEVCAELSDEDTVLVTAYCCWTSRLSWRTLAPALLGVAHLFSLLWEPTEGRLKVFAFFVDLLLKLRTRPANLVISRLCWSNSEHLVRALDSRRKSG